VAARVLEQVDRSTTTIVRAIPPDQRRARPSRNTRTRTSPPPGRVTVAVYSGDIIPAKTLREIIRRAGLTDDQFRDVP
jgi:hypothetical protein